MKYELIDLRIRINNLLDKSFDNSKPLNIKTRSRLYDLIEAIHTELDERTKDYPYTQRKNILKEIKSTGV